LAPWKLRLSEREKPLYESGCYKAESIASKSAATVARGFWNVLFDGIVMVGKSIDQERVMQWLNSLSVRWIPDGRLY
jgi:hypothetical protein